MEIPPLALQFAGSLAAILALAALARFMGLGGKSVLADAEAVRKVAGELTYGFEADRVSVARAKDAALAADQEGRIMLIKRHGNRFAGRILDASASVREEVDGLVVDPGDARFGIVRLSLSDAAYWADKINRL